VTESSVQPATPRREPARAPETVCVRDVLVTPYVDGWIGGPDPELIPEHGRLRAGRGRRPLDGFRDQLRAEPAEPTPGSHLYGGPFYWHFGHIMLDAIPRLWAYDNQRHVDGVIFPVRRKTQPPHPSKWFREILSAFGVKKDYIRLISSPVRVERLWFAPPGSLPGAGPEPWYWEQLARVEHTLLQRADPALPTPERLFLGRLHIHNQGSFMGERYFAEVLARNGYVYFKPEDHRVVDQVRIFRSARAVVVTEGSAAHLTELMTPFDADVTLLMRRDGGDRLFAPHLSPRCRFEAAGRESDIVRLWTTAGEAAPSAPSYHLRPERTFDDLVRLGVIAREAFDAKAYAVAERADALALHADRPDVAEAQLARVAALRADRR
jgi:hypothetical protein